MRGLAILFRRWVRGQDYWSRSEHEPIRIEGVHLGGIGLHGPSAGIECSRYATIRWYLASLFLLRHESLGLGLHGLIAEVEG